MKLFSFNLFGFNTQINVGFLLLCAFLYNGLDSIALLVSLIIGIYGHELSHALVARRLKYTVIKMMFHFVGAVAMIKEDLDDDVDALLIVIAGPLFNAVAAVLGLLLALTTSSDVVIKALSEFVAVNIFLAGFNLIPAFPMDGRRIFNSMLGLFNVDNLLKRNIIDLLSSLFGVMFVVYGIMSGGAGMTFIGFFLVLNVIVQRITPLSSKDS